MPDLRRGEILAVLDAGCYAESYANHLNSIPLPAAVLINDGKVDLIRKAETIEYMFANQVIPERLKASKVNA
jgi:diaminopimelate decarboxylase